jgi:hypothetical protein
VPALDTQASRLLWLRPEWVSLPTWLPALATYVALAAPSADLCLCVELPGEGPELALALLGRACEAVSAGGPFADVLAVNPGEADGRPLTEVASAADVRGALGLPLVPPAISRDGAVAAKRLADDLQALLDGHRYALAADPFEDPEPLVSVRIPTWKGHELLVGRAIPSVLNGSYRNVEVVVCSDGPDPVCRAAVEAIADPRVRYVELPERPSHPRFYYHFWQTTGLLAANHALDACRGTFITPLDHDDAFSRDHVRDLLQVARQTGADFVHARGMCEQRDGTWVPIGSSPLRYAEIVHGAVLYSSRLGHMRYDPSCWMLGEPGDWNMWRRIQATGARIAFSPEIVVVHFKEFTSVDQAATENDLGRPDTAPVADDEEFLGDVWGTTARWLAEVPLRASAREVAA